MPSCSWKGDAVSQRRADRANEFSLDAIIWTNGDGVVVGANRLGNVLINTIAATPDILHLTDLVIEEQRARVHSAVRHARQGPAVEPIPVQVTAGGGVTIDAQLTVMSLDSDPDSSSEVAWRIVPIDRAWRGTPLRPVAEVFFLAAYSQAVSETLDLGMTYRRVVDRAVPFTADWCAIDLVQQGHTHLRRVAVGSREPDESQRVLGTRIRFPVSEESLHPGLDVLRTGRPVVLSEISDSHIRDIARSEDHFKTVQRLGIVSLMILPLRLLGQPAGTLTFATTTSGWHFTDDDLPLAAEMTARAQQAIENARIYQQAEDVSRIREHYLAVASHELRTPLAVVGGFAGLLLKQFERAEPDRERVELLSQELRQGVSRLEALTEDLLLGASIHRAKGSFDVEMVDLVALLQAVAERFNVAAEGQLDHRLILDVPGELIGRWNPELLERAVSNLVANAIKYSPAGGDVTISLSRKGDDQVVIQVSDQGMGIAEEELDRLFDPFERGSEARKMSGGTGLGLYITRQVVDQHGGAIVVHSSPGAGSTFTITLPVRSGVDGADREESR